MATRKGGDGSRSADVDTERPGSYVKVSGSRRRRKRRASQMPSASEPPDSDRIVDTVGEEEPDEGRRSDLDLVDDLRRSSKPSSNRPRQEIGPLGIDDIRSDPPENGSASDRARSRGIVEINASAEPLHDPFGEEVTTRAPVSSSLFDEEVSGRDADDTLPPASDDSVTDEDRELAREYALDALIQPDAVAPELRLQRVPARDVLAQLDDYDADARHSLSSVLGARPSLRPSPQPEKQRDSASALWWLVVASLIAIIAAAGAIAAREQFADREDAAPVAASEPEQAIGSAPSAPPPSKPAVSFGTPQTDSFATPAPVAPAPASAKPERAQSNAPRAPAKPAAASAVPRAQSAAVRAGAPYTSAVTGAASAKKPSPANPAASAVKPSEPKPVSKPAAAPAAATAPAAEYAPGYSKGIEGASYAPGYNPPASADAKPALRPGPDPERGKPDLTPAPESRDNELPARLPINPYE